MKVAVLAYGFGTRLGELHSLKANGSHRKVSHFMAHHEPLRQIDSPNLLWLWAKADVVRTFFQLSSLNSDFTVSLKTGEIEWHNRAEENWKVTLVDTGLNSMTGGRLGRLKKLLAEETFMLTYGDGLSNLDVNALIACHKANAKMVTVTTVHPGARFGELDIEDCVVKSFKKNHKQNRVG